MPKVDRRSTGYPPLNDPYADAAKSSGHPIYETVHIGDPYPCESCSISTAKTSDPNTSVTVMGSCDNCTPTAEEIRNIQRDCVHSDTSNIDSLTATTPDIPVAGRFSVR